MTRAATSRSDTSPLATSRVATSCVGISRVGTSPVGTSQGGASHNARRRAGLCAAWLAIFGAACASDSTSWSRGPYRELKSYTSVEFRRGPMKIDPRTGELSIAWAGARAPEGYPRILECHLYVFDDVNGNGTPDAGEVLQERSSRETCRKVIFDDIHLAPMTARGTLMAQLALHTEARYRSVSWKLVPD